MPSLSEINVCSEWRLTPTTRYRTSIFGRLILQVREEKDRGHMTYEGPVWTGKAYQWRDAKTEDVIVSDIAARLTELEAKAKCLVAREKAG